MVSKHPPVTIRFTPDDRQVLDELQARTGLTMAGVIRLALRTLRSQLGAEETAPKRKTKPKK